MATLHGSAVFTCICSSCDDSGVTDLIWFTNESSVNSKSNIIQFSQEGRGRRLQTVNCYLGEGIELVKTLRLGGCGVHSQNVQEQETRHGGEDDS